MRCPRCASRCGLPRRQSARHAAQGRRGRQTFACVCYGVSTDSAAATARRAKGSAYAKASYTAAILPIRSQQWRLRREAAPARRHCNELLRSSACFAPRSNRSNVAWHKPQAQQTATRHASATAAQLPGRPAIHVSRLRPAPASSAGGERQGTSGQLNGARCASFARSWRCYRRGLVRVMPEGCCFCSGRNRSSGNPLLPPALS